MGGNVDMRVTGTNHQQLRDGLTQALSSNSHLPITLESLDRFSRLRLELTVKVRRISRRHDEEKGGALVAVTYDPQQGLWVRLTVPDDTEQPLVARGAFSELLEANA